MRHLPRFSLAGGLGLAASFLVACGGGSGLLSGDQANSLNGQLNQISSAVAAGDCSGAADALSSFSSDVNNLSGVNPTLRDNLQQDAVKVGELANKDCHGTTTTPTTTTNTNTTSPTTTTPSTTTPTNSTPTQSNPNPPPATTPANPGTTSTNAGSGGAGLGNGNGSGNGGGNSGGASGGAGAGNGN